MTRILSTAAAIFFLAASFAAAGTFDALAEATGTGLPTPVYLQPGSVVKTEFKGNITADVDAELGSVLSPVTPATAKSSPSVQAKPAVAAKERRSGAMAPPPKMNSAGRVPSRMAAATDADDAELEDLEKDLVLKPPPPKAEDKGAKSVIEKKASERKTIVFPEKKAEAKKPEAKKPTPTVRKMQPEDYGQVAVAPRAIQKVRPVTRNWWSSPAGGYGNRPYPGDTEGMVCSPGCPPVGPRGAMTNACRPPSQDYTWPHQPATSHGVRANVPSSVASGERIVRDGVTIKLAPAAAPAGAVYPDYYTDESSASDLLSAAAEIIGMPFAFIGSFF